MGNHCIWNILAVALQLTCFLSLFLSLSSVAQWTLLAGGFVWLVIVHDQVHLCIGYVHVLTVFSLGIYVHNDVLRLSLIEVPSMFSWSRQEILFWEFLYVNVTSSIRQYIFSCHNIYWTSYENSETLFLVKWKLKPGQYPEKDLVFTKYCPTCTWALE